MLMTPGGGQRCRAKSGTGSCVRQPRGQPQRAPADHRRPQPPGRQRRAASLPVPGRPAKRSPRSSSGHGAIAPLQRRGQGRPRHQARQRQGSDDAIRTRHRHPLHNEVSQQRPIPPAQLACHRAHHDTRRARSRFPLPPQPPHRIGSGRMRWHHPQPDPPRPGPRPDHTGPLHIRLPRSRPPEGAQERGRPPGQSRSARPGGPAARPGRGRAKRAAGASSRFSGTMAPPPERQSGRTAQGHSGRTEQSCSLAAGPLH